MQQRIRTLWRKEKLGILEVDTIKQVQMKVKKITSDEGGRFPKQTLLQKPHQRDKHLNIPSINILGTKNSDKWIRRQVDIRETTMSYSQELT